MESSIEITKILWTQKLCLYRVIRMIQKAEKSTSLLIELQAEEIFVSPSLATLLTQFNAKKIRKKAKETKDALSKALLVCFADFIDTTLIPKSAADWEIIQEIFTNRAAMILEQNPSLLFETLISLISEHASEIASDYLEELKPLCGFFSELIHSPVRDFSKDLIEKFPGAFLMTLLIEELPSDRKSRYESLVPTLSQHLSHSALQQASAGYPLVCIAYELSFHGDSTLKKLMQSLDSSKCETFQQLLFEIRKQIKK